MGLDAFGAILGILNLFLYVIDKLLSVKRHPANDAVSKPKPPTISSESEAQNRKIAEMNDRLFNK